MRVTHIKLCISSVQLSCSVMSDSLWPHESQHARPPCPSPTPGVCPNSCPSSQWCHPAISSSVAPFSFPNLSQHQGLFQWVNFTRGGQSIGVSASTSVLPMNTQDWSPLEWTGWISLQSRGLSRVFSNTIVQKRWLLLRQINVNEYPLGSFEENMSDRMIRWKRSWKLENSWSHH